MHGSTDGLEHLLGCIANFVAGSKYQSKNLHDIGIVPEKVWARWLGDNKGITRLRELGLDLGTIRDIIQSNDDHNFVMKSAIHFDIRYFEADDSRRAFPRTVEDETVGKVGHAGWVSWPRCWIR